MSTYAQLQTGL